MILVTDGILRAEGLSLLLNSNELNPIVIINDDIIDDIDKQEFSNDIDE